MGNLLRKGSPRPSKPFLKIRRKVRRKAGARKFRRARRTGESRAQAICRSSSRFRVGRSHAEFTKPFTKPPGARKFRRARRGEAMRNLRSHSQSRRTRGNFARRGAPQTTPRRLTFRKSRGESRSNEASRNLRSPNQKGSCRRQLPLVSKLSAELRARYPCQTDGFSKRQAQP